MPWDDDLQPGPAREFASAAARHLRALAGPGAGKSYSLRRRVARLIEEFVPSERIFVVTFTRTAAQDLVASLRDLGESVDGVDVRTLHSFCFSMLSREGVLRATGRIPRVTLEFESDLLLLDLPGDFGGIKKRRELRRALEASWARLQAEEPGEPVEGVDRTFQTMLLDSLRWHRALLIGEVVPISLHYLRTNPLAEERGMFDHVLVDEYQDLNRAEQVVIDLLGDRNLAVIGDDDQSIYGFKWANPDGIRTFPASHTGTVDVAFLDCRRCPGRVVEMANGLITRNMGRIREPLRPLAGNPDGDVHHVQWSSLEGEAAGLAAFVQRRISSGTDPGQILILAQRRRIGYAIRDALDSQGIDVRSFFREQQIDSATARETLTLLALVADPDDRVALRAWLAFGASTFRKGPYQRALAEARSQGVGVGAVLAQIASGDLRVPHLTANSGLVVRWRELMARLDELRPLVDDLPALVGVLLGERTVGADADDESRDDLMELRQVAEACAADAESLAALASAIRYRIAQPEVPLETPYARVMSFHKSKGLTAEVVILAGLVEGILPSAEDPVDPPDVQIRAKLEEARRLFYVGLTRSSRTLVLSTYSSLGFQSAMQLGARRGRSLPGGRVRVVASRFMGELGARAPDAEPGRQWLARQDLDQA